MEIKKRTIKSLIDKEYKDYSKYVVYQRAIPYIMDGFKPTARKIFHIMLTSGKQLTKVSAINGAVIKDANYHHGDCSGTIVNMTQEFAGSNNLPYFLPKGNFGTKIMPNSAAAPRYIFSKFNPLMHSIYKDLDLCPKNSDLENPEPEYYLPILPMVLVNGARGIAVGYATEIQPRNPIDIINQIRRTLNGEYPEYITPYFHGYKGEVEKTEDGVYMYGSFDIVNNKEIVIDEIPLGWNIESYTDLIHKLQDAGIVKDYKDKTSADWKFQIKLSKTIDFDNDAWQFFKLITKLSENIVLIDPDGKLKIYDSVEQVIFDFVNYRLKYYEIRRLKKIETLQFDIDMLLAKIRFIENNYIDEVKSKTKKEIYDFLIEHNFTKDQISHCLNLPLYRFTTDEVLKSRDKVIEHQKELDWYNLITPTELYKNDLDEAEKEIKKFYERETE